MDPENSTASDIGRRQRDDAAFDVESLDTRGGHSLYLTLLVLVAIFGSLWIWMTRVPAQGAADAAASRTTEVPQPGFAAPDFELSSLEGDVIRLSDFRGRPVILNFWATWCPPCRAEMPAIQNVATRHRDAGLIVLLINEGEDAATIRGFLTDIGVDLSVALDSDGAVGSEYRVRGLPTTVFVRADGTIEDVAVGGPMTEPFLEDKVSTLLTP